MYASIAVASEVCCALAVMHGRKSQKTQCRIDCRRFHKAAAVNATLGFLALSSVHYRERATDLACDCDRRVHPALRRDEQLLGTGPRTPRVACGLRAEFWRGGSRSASLDYAGHE